MTPYSEEGRPERVELSESSSAFIYVSKAFQKHGITKAYDLTVLKVEEVLNAELSQKFESKRSEYRDKYGGVDVVQLFHGTKSARIPSILCQNLQVERWGNHVGSRFGAGVCFSAFPNVASYYSDTSNSQMLLCNVLVSEIVNVRKASKYAPILMKPPYIPGRGKLRYDTTARNKQSMDIIVKFENHTFHPAYVIHFKKTKRCVSDEEKLHLNNKAANLRMSMKNMEDFAPKWMP